jgi:hypothetical protein
MAAGACRMMLAASIHEPQTEAAAHRFGNHVQVAGALLVIVGIPILCILGDQAGILRIIFPPLSVLVGAFLLWRSKPAYLGLVCWLWFLTPFLRRITDFQGGWTQSSPVLLAPYITAGLSGLSLLPSLRCLCSRRTLPHVCALVAVVYGLVIGLVRFPLFNVLQALLNWSVPVIFGIFIYHNRALYPQFRRVIERSFLFGVLVTGAYGIYQFFTLPDWDRLWLLNVQTNSFGAVEAMKIRAFSTMNAPAIFAAVMFCGLMLLFNMNGKLRLLSAGCGFVALLLTSSRASWLSLVAGAAFLLACMEIRPRIRLAFAMSVCALLFLGLMQIPAVGNVVLQRAESFSDPLHDVSFSARIQGHEEAFRVLAQEPFGEGLGSTDTQHATEGDDDIIGPHDSTLLEVLYSLGWIGSLIYVLGLGSMIAQLARSARGDSFVLSSQAILIGFLAQSLLNSVMLGVLGFMVWTFASMTLAATDCETAVERPAEHRMNQELGYAAV